MRNFLFVSDDGSAFRNLATDEWFLDHVSPEDLILYFYQNDNAVIIGKNQNPWIECDLSAMKEDGVQLARRVSGGGAVYHDGGNLNFSFIAGRDRYDKDKFLSLVLRAVQSLGIPCEYSGRNDMLVNGKKFSGHAVCDRRGNKIYHGTLLLSSDMERLTRYLTVDPAKIRSKGIDSVRSRVCNLTEFREDLTAKDVKYALCRAFEEEYGYFADFQLSPAERAELETYVARFESDEWNLGKTPVFDFSFRHRFPFGGVELCLTLRGAAVERAQVFTDAMDPSLACRLEGLLVGLPFREEAIRAALAEAPFEEAHLIGEEFRI